MRQHLFIAACLLIFATEMRGETSDSTIVRILEKEGVNFSHNNKVTLLTTGKEKFDDMFKAIRQARSSIHLEYFNFRNDSIASELFNLLREKVKEGVEVRGTVRRIRQRLQQPAAAQGTRREIKKGRSKNIRI